MAASKVNREDAQEWLESLQQVGEGWYRQVALAVRANAHKALGMERREFAQQIGQRMIDPREAIIELHNEGHSQNAIADVLGVDQSKTVARILAEEGLVEAPPSLTTGQAGTSASETTGQAGTTVDGTAEEDFEVERDELQAEIEHLAEEAKQARLAARDARQRAEEDAEANVKRQTKQLREEVKGLKEKVKAYARDERKRLQDERDRQNGDREQTAREAEALEEQITKRVMGGFVELEVGNAVSALNEATQIVRRLNEMGAEAEALEPIQPALDALTTELEVTLGVAGLARR